MKGYDFRTAIARYAPEYAVEYDEEGQVVIYTGLYLKGDDEYVPDLNERGDY